MSEHHNPVARVGGSSAARRRRWMIGAVAVLGAGGLAFGAIGVPVTADDLSTTGNVHASAEAQGDCVTAAAGTGDAEGATHPLQATGQGTATVTVCRDGLGDSPPVDPGGDPAPGDDVVPEDLDDVVPEDLDDVVPEDLAGELSDVVTGVLEDGDPGDGGFPPGDPGGEIPGGGDDVVPGDVGGLVPDGLGLVPNLLDRLAQIIPPAVGDGGPDGNGGGGPAINPTPSGPASGSGDVGGANADVNAEGGAATDPVVGTEVVGGEPGLVGTGAASGGSLPRTGGAPGSGLLRLLAFLGIGRALFGMAKRTR